MKLILIALLFCFSNSDASFRDQYVKTLVTQDVKDYLTKPLQPDMSRQGKSLTNFKVGIIGAGVSGLYAALILNSLGINYEIFEANKDHVGGRAFTYYFNKNRDPSKCQSFYDYVEIGAMRIPKINTRMVGDESWSLVNYLANSPKVKLNKPKLIKFYYSNDNSIYFYNNRRVFYSDDQLNDPLGFSDSKNGGLNKGVPDKYAAKAFWTWLELAVKPFTDLIATDPDKAYEFINKYEDNSVRSFLASFNSNDLRQSMGFAANNETVGGKYPQIVIDWIESLDAGTGFYDRSLAETVIDASQFGSPDWVTIDGGLSRLVNAMVEAVDAKNIRLGSKVSRISRSSNQLQITTENGMSNNYDHVITTVPLGLLQSIDTRDLNFDLKKRIAIRSLIYEASVKIGLKFKTRWWEDPKKMNGKPIVGGQTYTDLPMRKVVYPSFGVNCTGMQGNLLIYLWGQDATRFGGRIGGKIPSQTPPKTDIVEDALIQDVLNQLTLIHGSIVRKEYLNAYFAFDWNENSLSLGAFPLFGPAQFNNLYPSMLKTEVNGTLHFGGDATSVHHGWTLGAVNAGYRTVMEILMKENMQSKLRELKAKWGEVEELSYFQ